MPLDFAQVEAPNFDAAEYKNIKGADSIEQKAGIVLWGKSEEGELKVLAPYCQGRFSESDKTYTIGKGTVDKGESVWQAAKREFLEETGIDVERMLLPQGEGAYDGVKVVVKDQFPAETRTELKKKDAPDWAVQAIVRSGRDQPKEQTLYVIEVNGIEGLAQHCKGSRQKESPREIARNCGEQGLPGFTDLLAEMRVISQTKNQSLGKRLRTKMDASLADESVAKGTGLAAIEDWYYQARAQNFGEVLPPIGERHFTSEKQFDAFFSEAPEVIRNQIKDWAQLVKKKISSDSRYKDFIGDTAESPIKMDAKGRPLRYYSEGAEVIPFAQYLTKIEEDVERGMDAQDPMLHDYMETLASNEVIIKGFRDDIAPLRAAVTSQLEVLNDIYAQVAEKAEVKPDKIVSANRSAFPLMGSAMPLTPAVAR